MDALHKTTSYDIGGVRYPQPFKIRRLGHFGFNIADLQAGIDFYSKLLGFRITDTRDFSKVPGREEMAKRLTDPRIVFMSHIPTITPSCWRTRHWVPSSATTRRPRTSR